MRRGLPLLLAVLLCASALFGCGGEAAYPQIEYLIGVSLANLREPWRLVMADELEQAAAQYDNVRLIFTDAGNDSDKQKRDIDRLLGYGVDLLIVSFTDVEKMTPVVEQAHAQVPVVVLNRAVKGFGYSLYIGPDNELIGRMAGQAVLGLDAPVYNVLELAGSEASPASAERTKGFEEALGVSGINIERVVVEEESRDAAQNAVERLDMQGIDAVFAHNDFMALGAYLALQEAGVEHMPYIIGMDGFSGENGGLELVRSGIIYQTITCPTGGRQAIQHAMEILGDVSGVPKQVILRSHAVDASNVDEYERQLASPSTPYGKTIRAGYAQVGTESGWRIANNESIRQAARDFGIDLTMVDANQSQAAQIKAVRQFIAEDMDVIIISPVVDSGWEQVLSEAKAAGIPVLLSDRKIAVEDESLFSTFIGADFIEEGRRAMRWVEENVPVGEEPVRIMELRGTDGSSPAIERKKGFEDVLRTTGGYELVYSADWDFTMEGGEQAIEDYIAGNEWDIDIIFSHNDDMALGAMKALESHGISPGSDVKMISIDGTREAVKAIVDGKMNCVVECSPLLGPQLMKAVVDLMDGKELPLHIITDEIVFTKENANEQLKGRKY